MQFFILDRCSFRSERSTHTSSDGGSSFQKQQQLSHTCADSIRPKQISQYYLNIKILFKRVFQRKKKETCLKTCQLLKKSVHLKDVHVQDLDPDPGFRSYTKTGEFQIQSHSNHKGYSPRCVRSTLNIDISHSQRETIKTLSDQE